MSDTSRHWLNSIVLKKKLFLISVHINNKSKWNFFSLLKPLDQIRWNSDRIYYNAFLKSTKGLAFPKVREDFYATFEVNSNYAYDGIIQAYNDVGNSTPTKVRILPYEGNNLLTVKNTVISDTCSIFKSKR